MSGKINSHICLMLSKINSHICLMLSVTKLKMKRSNMAAKKVKYYKI